MDTLRSLKWVENRYNMSKWMRRIIVASLSMMRKNVWDASAVWWFAPMEPEHFQEKQWQLMKRSAVHAGSASMHATQRPSESDNPFWQVWGAVGCTIFSQIQKGIIQEYLHRKTIPGSWIFLHWHNQEVRLNKATPKIVAPTRKRFRMF